MLATCFCLILITSCTRLPGGSSRDIASIDQGLVRLNQDDLQKEMQHKFIQIQYTMLSAYEGMTLFDEHLMNTSDSLEQNPHYPGLLAARIMIEELQDEVIERRDQLYLAAFSPSLTIEDRLKSIELIKATLPPTKGELDILIHHQLHQSTVDFSRQMLLDLSRLEENTLRRSMEDLYKLLGGVWGPLATKDNLVIGDWRKITDKALEKNKSNAEWQMAKRNYEHRAQEMRSNLRAAFSAKNNKAFFPSTTKAGNIIGTEFPEKVWSLTFDDGPGAQTSRKILAHLARHNLPATFFQLTKNAKAIPAITKEIREAGMEIAAHSYSHQQTPKLSQEQRDHEIRVAALDLGELHGRTIKFYRLPYGAGVSTPDIRERIATANMIHVFWSVDTLDWMAQDPSEIVARTIKQIKSSKNDAGVILFHDIHERTVVASEKVMQYLKEDSRRVCKLEEIVEAMNKGEVPCPAL
jgi:peptidoglycan/xylan/chitin deacetylase (PgdA/CDA1 family)